VKFAETYDRRPHDLRIIVENENSLLRISHPFDVR